MLELLQPQAGDKVLEVGSGSGWQTTLLAHIVSSNRPATFKNSQRGRSVADGVKLSPWN